MRRRRSETVSATDLFRRVDLFRRDARHLEQVRRPDVPTTAVHPAGDVLLVDVCTIFGGMVLRSFQKAEKSRL